METAFRLDDFSSRTLNILASIFGGVDARVVLSNRQKQAATLVLKSRVLMLDPAVTTLWDLAVLARMLKVRKHMREAPQKQPARDKWLTRRALDCWLGEATCSLLAQFPGLKAWWGLLRDENGRTRHLAVRAESVETRPLSELISWGKLGIQPSMVTVPELDVQGGDKDFDWLIDAIERGQVALETLPGLEQVPYVRIPFRVSTAERSGYIERWESLLQEGENKCLLESLLRCHREKSEVRESIVRRAGRHRESGLNLDTDRLLNAVIDSRAGIRPRLFRQRSSLIQPVFNPNEQVAVLSFDVNDLCRRRERADDVFLESGPRFLAVLLKMYELMEIETVVLAFADHMVELAGGRCALLHCTTVVKTADDEFGEAFVNKLFSLVNRPPEFPGEQTCLHPLAFADISNTFLKHAETRDQSLRWLAWWAPRGPSRKVSDVFLKRSAEMLDRQFDDLAGRLNGDLDTEAIFIAWRVRELSRPGGYVSRAH